MRPWLILTALVALALTLGACGGDDNDPTDPGNGDDSVYDPPDVTESAMTGSMNVARDLHTATLLKDGRVLVTGGWDGADRLASCELYDPEAGTWSLTTPLGEARAFHTATLMADGRVYVCGGSNAQINSTYMFEIFDPETETWSEVNYADHTDDHHRMWTHRQHHRTNLLPDATLLITGGFSTYVTNQNGTPGEYLRRYEFYDPTTNVCYPRDEPYPRMNSRRSGHTATTMVGGRVLIAGGFNNEDDYHAFCDIFDPTDDTLTAAAAMPGAHWMHEAHLLDDGRVLVAGGANALMSYTRDCCLYDPATDTWSATGSMREARKNPASVKLPDGRVMVGGNASTGTVEIYTPSTGTWALIEEMSRDRTMFTMTVFPNGVVLIAGGLDREGGDDVYLESCELFVPPAVGKE